MSLFRNKKKDEEIRMLKIEIELYAKKIIEKDVKISALLSKQNELISRINGFIRNRDKKGLFIRTD